MDKIIVCQGKALIPARFWSWAVIKRDEYSKELKDKGFIETQCRNYLTLEQLAFLENNSRVGNE